MMSGTSSNVPVTAEEVKYAQEILQRMQAQGHLPSPSSGLQSEGFAMPEMSGGMTDASKRLRGPDALEEEELGFDVIPSFKTSPDPKQLPSTPAKKTVSKITLPEDIHSVEEWGNTVCKLQKVKELSLTYQELAENKDHADYVKWVIDHGQSKGPRCADFRNYLLYSGRGEDTSMNAKYPGTTMPREMRTSKK